MSKEEHISALQSSSRSKAPWSRGQGLRALHGLNLDAVNDFDDMLRRMSHTSFQGRNLGRAADVLELMFTEPHNMVILTISGALTVAQQGPIFVELISSGLVDIVVGTGALMTHDVVENMGFSHYEAPRQSDAESYQEGICRVFDSVELETSLDSFEKLVASNYERLLPAVSDGRPRGSADFCRRLGQVLLETHPQHRSILSAAAEVGVPIYIPAFTDSEMALNLLHGRVVRAGHRQDPFRGVEPVPYNGFVDLLDFTRRIESHRAGNLCIFTLGGGVPRNWAQQVAPTLDIMQLDGYRVHAPRFSRGVRICPDPPSWGHLSGCTYEEGISWAKFLPRSEGGLYAEVMSDATLVLPLLVKGVLQRLAKKGWVPAHRQHPTVDTARR